MALLKKSSIQVDDNGARFAVQWFLVVYMKTLVEWHVDNGNSKILHRHKLSFQIGTILTPDTLLSCFRICKNTKTTTTTKTKQTYVKIGKEVEEEGEVEKWRMKK